MNSNKDKKCTGSMLSILMAFTNSSQSNNAANFLHLGSKWTIFTLRCSSMKVYFGGHRFRPWPNDSIFRSIFSSTFDLKVERLLSVVEHMWPNGSIFARLFSRLFNYSYFRNACQRKIFTITNICPLNETLLRMLSLDLLDKVAKRLDFHSTRILLLDFLTKIKLHSTSLDSTRLAQQDGQTARLFPRFFIE